MAHRRHPAAVDAPRNDVGSLRLSTEARYDHVDGGFKESPDGDAGTRSAHVAQTLQERRNPGDASCFIAVPVRVRTFVHALIVCVPAALVGTACGQVDDPRPAAWEYLSPRLFQPNCATSSCHSRAAAVSGLDFSDPDRGYTSLTGLKVWIVDPQGRKNCLPMEGQTVCQRDFRPMVTPFDPAQSRLVHMLRARGASRMPPDRPLPEADIQLVERWILNGARRHLAPFDGADAALDGGVWTRPAGPMDAADGSLGDGSTD